MCIYHHCHNRDEMLIRRFFGPAVLLYLVVIFYEFLSICIVKQFHTEFLE